MTARRPLPRAGPTVGVLRRLPAGVVHRGTRRHWGRWTGHKVGLNMSCPRNCLVGNHYQRGCSREVLNQTDPSRCLSVGMWKVGRPSLLATACWCCRSVVNDSPSFIIMHVCPASSSRAQSNTIIDRSNQSIWPLCCCAADAILMMVDASRSLSRWWAERLGGALPAGGYQRDGHHPHRHGWEAR
jgi:hypothetical protein